MRAEHNIRVLFILSSILLSVDAICTSNNQPNVLVRLCCPSNSDENTSDDSAAYPRSITLHANVNNNSLQHKVRFGCPSDNNEPNFHYEDIEDFYLNREVWCVLSTGVGSYTKYQNLIPWCVNRVTAAIPIPGQPCQRIQHNMTQTGQHASNHTWPSTISSMATCSG